MLTLRWTLAIAAALAISALPTPGQDDMIAIDVLLRPGPMMLVQAAMWNAKLRERMPDGFELDEQHAPHITLVQCFVSQADLPKVLEAVHGVKEKFDLFEVELRATGLEYVASGEIGVAGFVVERTGPLLKLQRAAVEAVDAYRRTGGGEAAFVPDPSGMPFDPKLIEDVETYVPGRTGDRFNPHVTVGVAPLGSVEELEREPFEPFSFGVEEIGVYQLGNFGTAAKRLDHGN